MLGVWERSILSVVLLKLLTYVNQKRGSATVATELVAAAFAKHCQHLLCARPVFGKCLSLPSKDNGIPGLSYGGCSVILNAVAIAGDLGTKLTERLDENCRLVGPVDVKNLIKPGISCSARGSYGK